MKYVVSDACVACGFCYNTCPEVFCMKDDGTAEAVDSEVEAGLVDTAEDACNGCPVGAISRI